MPDTRPLPCSILRGGTSRGVFFRTTDLPSARDEIAPILLNVFGSPDIRQINGLGGATSQTSKAAIIGPPSRPDADVDYTFAQVSVNAPLVDWGGNCGNISSAVGPFAINAGYVPAQEGITVVRIHNTNTSKIIVAHVPVSDGRAVVEGDFAIPGVPFTGAHQELEFVDPAGSNGQGLLPTGNLVDELTLADGRTFRVSVVDAGNLTVFVLASDLGMTGTELPLELEARTDVTDVLEELRSIICEQVGLVDDRANATKLSPGLPKVGMVAPPTAYKTTTGESVAADAIDITGRLMSMQTAHRSYMVTGAIATAAAVITEGTLVNQVARATGARPDPSKIRIANPYGVMDTIAKFQQGPDGPVIESISVGRTARHILDGQVWVPNRLLESRDAERGASPEPVAVGSAS